MALEYLAKRTRETLGLEHIANLKLLRDYLKRTDPETILREIERITDPDLLKTLWEAGLRWEQQLKVIEILKKLP